MHYSTIDRAPMFVAVVRTIARLDVALQKMDAEDREALADWIFHEGYDISPTAKALLLADLMNPTATSNQQESESK